MAENANAQRNESMLGLVLGEKFRVDALIGTGATGSVYKGVSLEDQSAVAIKILDPDLVNTNPTAPARFRREARQAMRIRHPNAMFVLDHGESNGLTYIVMELLEGRELYSVIYDDFPLPTDRVVRIMSEILSALEVAHSQGIVHRDLKPENILLVKRPGPDGQMIETVKVADFGIAKSFEKQGSEESLNLTRHGVVHGTPEYMAPEQARGDTLDGRTDLYSVGTILYEMLVGELPFSAKNPFDVILKQVSAPVDPPSKRRPGIDTRLEPVIMRALQKLPQDRFASATEMRESILYAVGMGQAPVATPPARKPTPREIAPTMEASEAAREDAAAGVAPPIQPIPTPSHVNTQKLKPVDMQTAAKAVLPQVVTPSTSSRKLLWLVLGIVALAVIVFVVLQLRASHRL